MADYPKLWIRTVTGTVSIPDLGITIDTTGRQLIGDPGQGEFAYDELASSDDLRGLLGNGNIQWSEDGAIWTLSHQDAGDILSTFTQEDHDDYYGTNPHGVNAHHIGADPIIDELNDYGSKTINQNRLDPDLVNSTELSDAIAAHHEPTSADHDDRYFTEAELASAGSGAQVHYENIIGKPGLSEGKYDPVYARVVGKDLSSAPYPALQGMIYLDNQATPHVHRYNGSTWDDLFAVETSGVKSRFIDLSDGDESIFTWNGAGYTDGGAPSNNYQVNVRDDGDDKQAVYGYVTTTNRWVKLGDVDWIAQALDDAYDDSPSLDKVINVDDGPVDLNQTDSYTPQVINEKAAKPSVNPVSGKTGWISVDNITYKWDTVRSKWLSVERRVLWFGVGNNGQKDRYLPFSGIIPSLNAGYRLPRNSTLVEVMVDSENSHTGNYKIAKKASPTSFVHTFVVTSATGGQALNINIDFTAGDVPVVKMEPSVSDKVDYPVVGLVFAHRL